MREEGTGEFEMKSAGVGRVEGNVMGVVEGEVHGNGNVIVAELGEDEDDGNSGVVDEESVGTKVKVTGRVEVTIHIENASGREWDG